MLKAEILIKIGDYISRDLQKAQPVGRIRLIIMLRRRVRVRVRVSTEETSRDIYDITKWVQTTFSISVFFNPRSKLFLLGGTRLIL